MSSEIHQQSGKHPKQDFQVERIAFFSDAVFAIAITLLIIDLKIPHVTKESTYDEVLKEVWGLKYMFIAVLVSFALILGYWMRHHLLFKHIHNYNKYILLANMFTLVPIIFFPFTTAFLYESINNDDVLSIPFRLFILNQVIAAVTQYYLYWTVIIKYRNMCFPMEKSDKEKFQKNLFTFGISFLLVFILSFFVSVENSLYGMLVAVFANLYVKYFKKAK